MGAWTVRDMPLNWTPSRTVHPGAFACAWSTITAQTTLILRLKSMQRCAITRLWLLV